MKTKGEFGEEYVNQLAYNSYLKYWCYPNPKDINGNNKEICDLLILFFDTAIIISVKNYDLNGNYQRYIKKVIEKSTKQLFGAERKLFFSQRDVIISHPEKGEELFNPNKYKDVFRITVSVGNEFEKYEFIDNKEGKGCVNIFNKETFQTIIQELDTIKDLTEYLKKRELLIKSNEGKIVNCKEKDLLASYLMNKRIFPAELFLAFEDQTLKLKDEWQNYISNKSVILKKLADEKSYFIDELIRNDVLKLDGGDLLAAELMTMSRFERRIVANNLFEVVGKFQDKDDFLARRFASYNGVGFLFMYYPIERPQQEIDYITQKAMELYSYFYNTSKIVLLAAAKDLVQWKFALYESSTLTPEIESYFKEIAKQFGWFKNVEIISKDVKEYPDE